MVTHAQIWNYIDKLAERHDLSASGLALKSGLDATTFNRSKRTAKDGRERWPSSESFAKISNFTQEPLSEIFASAVAAYEQPEADLSHLAYSTFTANSIPMLGFAEAGSGGFFNHEGAPNGDGWDDVPLPDFLAEGAFALKVSGESMMPAYREGDVLIVSIAAGVRRGDRVVVRTLSGEVMAKILHRQDDTNVELHSIHPDHAPRTLDRQDVASMGRILWASQ